MNKLFKKIYQEVLVYEEDIVKGNRQVDKFLNDLTEPYKEQSTDDELERLKEYFIFNAMSQHPRNCYAVPRFLAVAKYLLKVICLFASELAQTNYLFAPNLLDSESLPFLVEPTPFL